VLFLSSRQYDSLHVGRRLWAFFPLPFVALILDFHGNSIAHRLTADVSGYSGRGLPGAFPAQRLFVPPFRIMAEFMSLLNGIVVRHRALIPEGKVLRVGDDVFPAAARCLSLPAFVQ